MIIMLQPDLGTGIVFIGIFFAMLFWSGVAWPLLLLIASPAISLILSFSVGLWGAWFFILLALVLWYRELDERLLEQVEACRASADDQHDHRRAHQAVGGRQQQKRGAIDDEHESEQRFAPRSSGPE